MDSLRLHLRAEAQSCFSCLWLFSRTRTGLPMFTPVHGAGLDMQPRAKSIHAKSSLKTVPLQGLGESQVAKDHRGSQAQSLNAKGN